MPAFARGWREGFFAVAVSGAVIIAATAISNLGERHDFLEVSMWLGAGVFLVLLALAALVRGFARAGFWLALPATLLGLAGVFGYLFAYNGFSASLARSGLVLMRAVDAHMSMSLALLLASGGVVMACTNARHGFGRETLAAAGIVLAALVLGVLFGQQFHLVPLQAGELAQRLLPAEGAMLLLVAVLQVFASALLAGDGFDLRNRLLPVLAFAVLLAASFHLWLVLVGQEQLVIRRQAAVTATRLAASVADHFEERVRALERMTSRMEAEAVMNADDWRADAKSYLHDFPSVSAIGWVTPDGRVKWAVSRDSDAYHVGEQYAVESRRRDALARAELSGDTTFSRPVPLRAGGFGHIVTVPLAREDAFAGWLVVGVRFPQLFSPDVESVAAGFAVNILEGGETIYSNAAGERRHPLAVPMTSTVKSDGLEWVVEAWSRASFFGGQFLWLPGVMLTLALLASLMFAVALYHLESHRRRTASLRESEERYRLTALQTGELVYDYHMPAGRVAWAGSIREITGESPETFSNTDIEAWGTRVHPDDAPRVFETLHRAAQSLESFVAEYRFRHKDGHYLWVEEHGVFLPGQDGRAERMLGTMADVTERFEFEQQLRHLAHFDQQTGLRNRVWFMEDAVRRSEQVARDGRGFWCVFLDVDRFRSVNETLGHVVGDVLLENIAQRVASVVGDRGELARVGGDEFGLCLPAEEIDRGAMMAFCEELMREFGQPLAASGHSLFVTLSVGIAAFPADGANIQEVIRAAETAMFRAKHRGRNTYAFYEASMSAGARENLEIANALRRALEREEFHLVFQPRYNLATGRVTGMEALLRWESAELGTVPPDVFIPIAEETGLIGPIGWYVVDAAATAARRLGDDAMKDRRMAINVSVRQLVHADFVPQLVARIEAAGAKPHWFEIELTESLMMEDPARARVLFMKLHEHGFTVAIDDFGTGYSSLSYLTHFPADCLKVDRAFVTGLPEREDRAAVVRTIVSLGQGLGMKIVAEGVETAAQRSFLGKVGCEEAQGFLFARPMGLGELEKVIGNRESEIE